MCVFLFLDILLYNKNKNKVLWLTKKFYFTTKSAQCGGGRFVVGRQAEVRRWDGGGGKTVCGERGGGEVRR